MTSRRTRERRRRLASAAELFALCGVAITQPVLDVFGRAPDVFIEAKAGRFDLWAFAAVVAFVPPLILFALELAVGAIGGSGARQIVHGVFLGVLVLLIAVRALRLAAGIEGPALLVLAGMCAVALLALRHRWSGLRDWLVFSAFAPVLFAAVFLFSSSASSLAQPLDESVAEAVEVVSVDEPRPPVVLLVLDELPVRSLLDAQGGIDAERYPGFAAFAAESTWYRNATTVATHTANAVPAILTGQYPTSVDAQPVATDHPDNLFRLLGNAYRLNVSELDTQLCAVPRCDVEHADNAPTVTTTTVAGADPPAATERRNEGSPLATLLRRARHEYADMVALHDIEAQLDVEANELAEVTTTTAPPTTTTQPGPVDVGSVPPTTVDRGLAKLPTVQPTRFSDWMNRIDTDTEAPALSVLHLTMPHNPWHLASDGTAYQFPDDNLHLVGANLGHWVEDAGASISARQRHLIQVRYVDTLVAALQARLVELDLWDDAIVIVTADHGAGFDPGGWFREWDATNQTNLLGVPLLVHGDGFTPGAVVDAPAQTVDIVPTIADVARVAPPWPVDGISLLSLPATDRTSHPVEATRYLVNTMIDVDVSGHLEALLASAPIPEMTGGDDLEILRDGPSGALIGRRVDEFSIDDNRGTIRIEYPADDTYAPDENGQVVAFITGAVDDVGANETVVIAVDGRIGATSLTFADNAHDARFAALLPPQWMTGAGHDVAYFLLDVDGSLRPLDPR